LTDKTGDEELNNNQVDKIVIHHTVTDSIEYDEYFKNRSNGESLSQLWSYVYYHFIVASDGTKIKHRELEEYSRATRKNNWWIHIAMQWDFTDHPPTLDQLVSVREIIDEVRWLYWDLQVYEHWELEGEHTACAGKSFDTSMLSREYIENLKNPPVVAAKEKDLWIYGMTRYYTPVPWQAKYYNKTYEAEYNMNCMGNCRSTASGYRLEEKDVWKILACPPNLKFWDVLRLEYSRWSIYATCQDRWWAIKGKRLDIWSWIWQAWYNNIFVNWSVPSWPARVYLQL
jgi:3D (Asp-Asp-Asp) domain-containing protein